MRYEEACRVADILPVRNPCYRVVMLARGVDLLRDLGKEPPAFTIPAASWLVVAQHEGDTGQQLFALVGRGNDTVIADMLHAAGQYNSRRNGRLLTRKTHGTLYTWVCPIHGGTPDTQTTTSDKQAEDGKDGNE